MMQKLGVRDAIERLAKNNMDFARLFERDAFDVGMYRPGTVDAQQPHKRDEIYVIATGSGEFVVHDERQPFAQGDVLFVPAASNIGSRILRTISQISASGGKQI